MLKALMGVSQWVSEWTKKMNECARKNDRASKWVSGPCPIIAGRFPHWVNGYIGERFSVIYYTVDKEDFVPKTSPVRWQYRCSLRCLRSLVHTKSSYACTFVNNDTYWPTEQIPLAKFASVTRIIRPTQTLDGKSAAAAVTDKMSA